MTEERAYWLAWTQISGVGPILLQRLFAHFGSLAVAWEAVPAELGKVEGFGLQTINKVVKGRSQINPQQLLNQHLQENPLFWTPGDVDYPRLLAEIPSPPPVLYYRGEVDLAENQGKIPLIGIVGTRQPTEYGIRWTRKISTALAKNGFTVVSGMAEGIDTFSHTAAMEAGGRTIAVLGTGVDVVYPHKNKELYKQILHQGLVISEYQAKTAPERKNFPRRNRIIAGLSRATLVMEAPVKSGALITAEYANEFCRDVYALPGRLDDIASGGCLKLLFQGAAPIPKELEDLLKSLGAIPHLDYPQLDDLASSSSAEKQAPSPNLSPELQTLMNIISSESLAFDLIVQNSGMSASFVSSSLLQLELMGLVSQLPGMRYQVN
ncbi:MAG: DNA-processing protein DprA [Cyanobacteria bacterium P01_A01_bin.84]